MEENVSEAADGLHVLLLHEAVRTGFLSLLIPDHLKGNICALYCGYPVTFLRIHSEVNVEKRNA